MKVLYLFNKVLGDVVLEAKKGNIHDSWLFGMLRLPNYGISTDFLEIEKFVPKKIASFLRKHILTMHYAHLPLFPLFFKYDVVFTSTAYSSLILKAILRIRSFKWVILDFNILGTIQNRETLKQKILYWAITNGADGIVAISQAEANALKHLFPHLKSRIIFLYEPTDINFFKQNSAVKETNQIISVGNYGRDFDTIIEAIKPVETKLFIATKLKIKESAAMSQDKVVVKELTPNQLVDEYSKSKIVIVSLNTKDTYYDSVGTLALGEALSIGKPTIVTYTKSMESYINNKNGVFVKRGDSISMRSAIENLIKDENLRKTLSINARKFAEEHLDPEYFAKELSRFLIDML